MRADRLLSLLLLLQAHGRLSASNLAARLEVSRRTIYRDVDALGVAGVPIRTEPGAGGGIELLEGWRTDLTGLTEPEVESLLTAAPGPALESALGKVAAALPGEPGRRVARVRERLLVDSDGWGRRTAAPTHLRAVQDAVFADRRLRLVYRRAEADPVVRLVDPLGLVLKAGTWYLLGLVDGQQRVFRLSRVVSAETLGEAARRPTGFDLGRAWREQTADWGSGRSEYQVTMRAEGEARALLLRVAGDRVADASDPAGVRLGFPAREPAAAFLASFGAAVEVVEPPELRVELARLGLELATLYGPRERYFERRQVREAIAWAEAGGIAVHRNFDSFDGTRSPRGFRMDKPFLHVIGLRAQLADWGRRYGLRPEWIQPEKRRQVAHYDVFGEFAQRLIERLRAP